MIKVCVLIVLIVLGAKAIAQEEQDTLPDQIELTNGDFTQVLLNQESQQDAMLETFVDGVIDAFRYTHSSPGYTVSVVRPDRTVFAKGYGLADIDKQIPVDPANTRFHVASISKTFVWTAAMILVDRGLLDLDKDVNTYLKRYQVKESEKPLSTNMLMAHRGGYEESFDVFSTKVTALPIHEALVQSEPKQVFPRGEVAAYSNWGSNLVTLIIEDISGQTYADFLYSELLEPLAMNATHLNEQYPNPRDGRTKIAENYFVKANGPFREEQIDMGSFAAVGGMTTTSVDMANWMKFHLNRGELNGIRLISEDTYQLMRTRVYDSVEGSAARVHGFGEMIHRSTLTYGHSGAINAFFSNFMIAPELGLGVFVSQNMNVTREPLSALPFLVFDRALQAQGKPDILSRPIPSEEDVTAAEEVAGKYVTSRRVVDGEYKFISAFYAPMTIKAKEGLLIIGDTKNAPYARIAEDLWENRLGYRFAIDRKADGSINLIVSPGGAIHLLPVTFWTDRTHLITVFAITVLLTLTTWLGFYRRVGHTKETCSTGKIMSVVALLGIIPILVLAAVTAQAPIKPGAISFANAMQNWPLPIVMHIQWVGILFSAFGFLLLVGMFAVWRNTQWPLWRRFHYSLYACFYAFTSILLIHWKFW